MGSHIVRKQQSAKYRGPSPVTVKHKGHQTQVSSKPTVYMWALGAPYSTPQHIVR